MSENEPRPAENPYGSQPPTNPYGQPVPPPHGEQGGPPAGPPPTAPYSSSPHGSPAGTPEGSHSWPQGEQPQAPYGTNPYAAAPYGGGVGPSSDQRPGTVTAAGWITIVMSALSAILFGLLTLVMLVAQEPMIREMRRQPGFEDLDIDASSIVGIMVGVMVVFALWSVMGIVLGVFVLRRSNIARILLVISSAVVALVSLIGIGSGVSAITLLAAGAVIVLLFVGGASDWFARRGPAAYGGGPYGGPGSPYGS